MDICKTERLKGGLEIGGIGNCKPFFYRSLVHNGLPNETLRMELYHYCSLYEVSLRWVRLKKSYPPISMEYYMFLI